MTEKEYASTRLVSDGYEASAESAVLPPLSSGVLPRFLGGSQTLPRTVWLRAVREWTRLQRDVDSPTSSLS